jgi:phage shock protein A
MAAMAAPAAVVDAEVDAAADAVDRLSLEERKNDPTEEEHRASLARISSLILSLREQLNPAAQEAKLEKCIVRLEARIEKATTKEEEAKLAKRLEQFRNKLDDLILNPEDNDQIRAAKKERAKIEEQLAALQQRQQPLPDAHQSIESEFSLQCVFLP